MSELNHEQQLSLISKAWGKQSGYCFFPWVSGEARDRETRIQSYHEGPAFLWPDDRAKILKHMKAHTGDDLWWCPSLFEKERRQLEFAMDEHCLWADLDEIPPAEIEDYPPSVAWETSPGRYQALWLVQPGSGDLQGASWRGGENQRLTYHLGADVSGWDTTQLLRIPGWFNHKPEWRKKYGKPPQGKLLWRSGRLYLPDDFSDLPEVPHQGQLETVLEDQIEAVNRREVWARVRLKCSPTVRELVNAKAVGPVKEGRSGALWQIERDLADAGCTAPEIVAIARETVWNKFAGRADELKRLTIEAAKAIQARSEEVSDALEEEREDKPKPQPLFTILANIVPPEWLVEGIWTKGACGFIAGQPKVFKSWCALDLGLSIATGMDFLNRFKVLSPGPVLYIQEEDGPPTVKSRVDKIWPAKQADRMVVENNGSGKPEVYWLPPREAMAEPLIMASINEGFILSDPTWQSWLDEVLEEGFVTDGNKRSPYRMVIMDPLMMIMGDVEENKAAGMTEKLFKPAKLLARKHSVAISIVHHMRKGNAGVGRGGGNSGEWERGGQLLLGSVANHAWAEDALYLKLTKGGVEVELESKTAPSGKFRVSNIRNKRWEPAASAIEGLFGELEDDAPVRQGENRGNASGSVGSNGKRGPDNRVEGANLSRGRRQRLPGVVKALLELGPGSHSRAKIVEVAGISATAASQQLQRLEAAGKAQKKDSTRGGHGWDLTDQYRELMQG